VSKKTHKEVQHKISHITNEQIFFYFCFQQWELLVLSRLKWDICSITPHDFVDHLMTRLDVSNPWGPVRRTAHGYIALCALEYKFAMCSPSMIASACVVAALRNELDPTMSAADLTVSDILSQLQTITNIETVSEFKLVSILDRCVFNSFIRLN
jgi:hypothetical protein